MVTGWRLSECNANDNNRLSEDVRSTCRRHDTIDTAQLRIELETDVGEYLWRAPLYILDLNALRWHADNSVTNALYFRCRVLMSKNESLCRHLR